MTRRHRNLGLSSDDSDSERENIEDSQYDTDLTEPEDEGSQDKDVSDAALLFADNEHPPEYYIQQLANFDETDYAKEDYGRGTTALLNRVEEKWSQYGISFPSLIHVFLTLAAADSAPFFEKTPERNSHACPFRSCISSWIGSSIFGVEKMEGVSQVQSVRVHLTLSGRCFAWCMKEKLRTRSRNK